MSLLARVALVLLLVLGASAPALAAAALDRVAEIHATAPLKDHSKESVKTAVREAVDKAVKVAVGMGLPMVQLRQARVVENVVHVRILATEPNRGDDEGRNGNREERVDL